MVNYTNYEFRKTSDNEEKSLEKQKRFKIRFCGRKIKETDYINTNRLPLEIEDTPWIYEQPKNYICSPEVGKWMLFYDNCFLNQAWIKARTLFRENKLVNIDSLKCSTLGENIRAETKESGVIIFFCSNSLDEKQIMDIGFEILEHMNYKEKSIIYYKTDKQTHEGTRATGCKKNHLYKLTNHLFSSIKK